MGEFREVKLCSVGDRIQAEMIWKFSAKIEFPPTGRVALWISMEEILWKVRRFM